uniref:Uncharacterized protein n=1 Tax=Rhizophora mucronata TaxID=61149 RepID=A0A2P2IIA5_RHIMU
MWEMRPKNKKTEHTGLHDLKDINIVPGGPIPTFMIARGLPTWPYSGTTIVPRN